MNNAKVRNTNYAGIVFHMMISLFLILVGTMELYSSLMKPLYYVFIICGFILPSQNFGLHPTMIFP